MRFLLLLAAAIGVALFVANNAHAAPFEGTQPGHCWASASPA